MSVETRVNGTLITKLDITNVTEKPSGLNTYRWVYTRHDLGPLRGLMSAQQGTVEHVYEDGHMVLISKVAQAGVGYRIHPAQLTPTTTTKETP